jgi:epoxyqueuosine reductase
VFRCDACQRACPRNQNLKPRARFPFTLQTGDDSPELIPLLLGDETYYQRAIPKFVQSAGADTIRRNAAIAAGNSGDPALIPGLIACLGSLHSPTRSAAAWALGRFGEANTHHALRERLGEEEDEQVRGEIMSALGE